jgi:YVTN family beta-propeller protein
MNLEKGEYYSNWYGAQNPKQLKELGDVGNDIQVYGHRLYAVINCSHKVEVMDLQARHIAQIDIPNCRYLAFKDSKLYVSAYVGSAADPELLGSVFEVDTASLTITREVKVGHQPDELCVVDNKLYVCNSGGYQTNRYDSTVSVIDLNSFTETEKIPVGLNPTRIRVDSQKRLWVCCQGNYAAVKPQVVIIGGPHIETPCANISIQGATAYIMDNENKRLRAFSTIDFAEQQQPVDISRYENPYGLLATNEALYITDAKNYVSSGVLYCYSYDGRERWKAYTGDIPGHLCCVSEAYDLYPDTASHESTRPYLSRVYEYVPATGQFVNELPKYEEGDDAASMCRKCEASIANNAQGLVSLGGWGGYITFGFDHAVENKEGRDIQILGNAFQMSGNEEYGSSEPGIVLVSRDENGNGLPDDSWYELKGCLYDDPKTMHHQTKTYTREGDTLQNPFHQHPYYPQWIEADAMTFNGTMLPSQTVIVNGQTVQRILEYGYVDNKPNTDIEGTSFDIDWAVDTNGQSVKLPSVDFVRVYTAVQESADQTGEISTEISGAIDLHIN